MPNLTIFAIVMGENIYLPSILFEKCRLSLTYRMICSPS